VDFIIGRDVCASALPFYLMDLCPRTVGESSNEDIAGCYSVSGDGDLTSNCVR